MSKGEKFLQKQYSELHRSDEVESAVRRTEARGERVEQQPQVRIRNYLDRLNEVFQREDSKKKGRGVEALRRIIYKKFVIKPEDIPEAYFENQRRIIREQGRGDIELSQDMRDQLAETIIADQMGSLDRWFDYLSSPDAMYPDWLKYYAMRGVLNLGEYDKDKKRFSKRSKGTVKPFPDLNREALAYVLDVIEKKQQGQGINTENLVQEDQEEFEKLIQGTNFAKLYAWAVKEATPASQEQITVTEGEWIKYSRNSDCMPLVRSLWGHGTGWCTAGELTAQTQLKAGDFYVYYSLDEKGNPTIPRVAIRMEENKIAEVRGIAEEQNLDSYIADVAEEKLREFPDSDKYKKRVADMQQLTNLEKRLGMGEDLTKEDLKFLYEIDSPIRGFGYDEDPRIKEIVSQRDVRADISFVLDMPPSQISLTQEEALSGDSLFHYGDLIFFTPTFVEGLTLPERVEGSIYFSALTSVEKDNLSARYPNWVIY